MAERISSSQLIDREDVLAALTGAIDASAAGSPRVILVRGEAGIGKSRLIREALAALPAETVALVGECLDIGEAGLPYLPVVEALRRFARRSEPGALERLAGGGRRDLAALVPELAGAPGAEAGVETGEPLAAAPDNGSVTSGLAQARLFERILDLLGSIASSQPVVFVIEDVHWIDRATRDLVTFLTRNLTDERLALVLSMREHHLPRGHPILAWLADVERATGAITIEPRRLDRSAVVRQLRQLADATVAPSVVDEILRRSDGNPLFVEELFASGADRGTRPTEDVLLARVTRLEPAARSMVEAAAVAGRPVDERLLALVLGVAEEDVDAPLRAAVANGAMEREPGSDRYRFRHELLREAVEGDLSPGARRRLHERFARRLEERPELADPTPAGAAAELAVHFAEAGLASDAYAHALRAADAAEAVQAYADAHRHLERALDLEDLVAEGQELPRRLALRRRAADDADLAGATDRALELIGLALDLVDASDDPVTAGLLQSRLGYLLWSVGDGERALVAHEAAVALVPPEPPTPERAQVLGALGGALMGAGRWAESSLLCEQAIACAEAAGATADESRARNMHGSDLVALGEVEAGLEELRAACRLATLADRDDMLIVGHHNLALNLATADRLDEALHEARAGLAVARRAGLARRFGQDLAALAGDTLTRLGRVDDAGTAVAEGLALDPAGRGTVYLSAVAAHLAVIHGDAAAALGRRAEIDLDALDPDVAAFVASVAAEAMLVADDPPGARREAILGLRPLMSIDDVLWSTPLVALGLRAVAEEAEADRARPRGAPSDGSQADAELLRERLDWLEGRVATRSARGWVALARGEEGRGRERPVLEQWRLAVEAFDAIPEPLTAAYARLRLAEAELRDRGLRADVADLLGVAAGVARVARAAPLAAAVAELAARARIPVTGTTADDHAPTPAVAEPAAVVTDPRAAAMALGLSAREVEVLELVTAGMTNGEIADRLFITRKTAAVHVTHILDKLGVANRVSAAMIGARVGLGMSPGAAEPYAADAASSE